VLSWNTNSFQDLYGCLKRPTTVDLCRVGYEAKNLSSRDIHSFTQAVNKHESELLTFEKDRKAKRRNDNDNQI
jgi:hypothetical protein